MGAKTQLILFTRSPFEPLIKTRLAGCCTEAQRRALLHAFVLDTLETIHQTNMFQPADICILTSTQWLGRTDSPPHQFNLPEWIPPTAFRLQSAGNLGQRQITAISEAHHQGFDRVVIVGSDSPTIRPRHFQLAAERLTRSELVLGPADDGGYYLLGLDLGRIGDGSGGSRLKLENVLSQLFADIAWSTDQVLDSLLENARDLGWKVRLLPEHYDVDACADLRRLAREIESNSETAPATAKCIASILGTQPQPPARIRHGHCH